jgi:general secretion pathway protein G
MQKTATRAGRKACQPLRADAGEPHMIAHPDHAQRVSCREAGFTLIELMLVVIIIGVIVAIAVPRMAGRQEQAKVVAAGATLKSVSVALDAFELDAGRFPTTEEGLSALTGRPASLAPEETWNGPYLRELPTDPWHRAFLYTCPAERGIDYDLVSPGPDGKEDTEDDVTNVPKNTSGLYAD